MATVMPSAYDPPMPNQMPTIGDVLQQVRYDHGCWEWTGGVHNAGYGRIGRLLVHRVVYELLIGRPEAETLDHLCRNRMCCNPDHLEPVSRAENARRGSGKIWNKRRAQTFCKHGHEFTPENTRTAPNRKGGMSRWCRQCDRDRAPRHRRKAQ